MRRMISTAPWLPSAKSQFEAASNLRRRSGPKGMSVAREFAMRSSAPWSGLWSRAILLAVGLCLAASVAIGQERVFELTAVSAFDLVEKASRFGIGLRGECRDIPDANVVTYPTLKSKAPIYGVARFGEEPRCPNPDSVIRFCFVVDESGGAGAGYDVLYFDLNRDLDLTNDGWLGKQESPPDGAMRSYSSIEQQACFKCVDIPLAFGAGGTRPLEVMPRVLISPRPPRTLCWSETSRATRASSPPTCTCTPASDSDGWRTHWRDGHLPTTSKAPSAAAG